MSANYSVPPHHSSLFDMCFESMTSIYIYSASNIVNILLLLPLSTFVLYLGLQRWKQLRSSVAVVNHADFYTYNMAVMELIGISGCTIGLCSTLAYHPDMVMVGVSVLSFPWYAQMLLPILICVERYLAVVHPITYMRLKKTAAVRIRYITTVCVWLLCCMGTGLMSLPFKTTFLLSVGQMALLFVITTFCSLSIICVLIRPRPGEAGGDRMRVDKSKRRAFKTMLIMMGVLWLRFGGNMACTAVTASPAVSPRVQCVVQVFTVWFNMPSSLVLPLLFLHRQGKLPGCKRNTTSD